VFQPVDLPFVAQRVGKPDRENCGACHFFGGGGVMVKHGDLDASLADPERALDVHMDAKGLNFSCTTCHTTAAHHIAGRHYATPAPNEHTLTLPRRDCGNSTGCESCHSPAPHKNTPKLNDHTDKVACETCHIPTFARKNPTKMWWDWSAAGKFDGKGDVLVQKDDAGNVVYHTKKGGSLWAKDVVPEYLWYNGLITYTRLSDPIDDGKPVNLNLPHGGYDDPGARIAPFKVHRGRQVYDPVNRTMVVAKLFGAKGSGAYWADYDWRKAVEAGMAEARAPFSGEVGFIETATYWPVAHMVAPKELSLDCEECHAKQGRLAALRGFYLPGRDANALLDTLGWLAVTVTALGAGIHGVMRFVLRGRD